MDFTKNQLPVMSDNQKIKICIVVEDGLVSEIFASTPKNLDIEILDFDGVETLEDVKELNDRYWDIRNSMLPTV